MKKSLAICILLGILFSISPTNLVITYNKTERVFAKKIVKVEKSKLTVYDDNLNRKDIIDTSVNTITKKGGLVETYFGGIANVIGHVFSVGINSTKQLFREVRKILF